MSQKDTSSDGTRIGNAVSAVKKGPSVSQRFARIYVLTLFGLILVGLLGALYFGIISPSASPDLTQPVEWFIKGMTVLFLFFTGAMVVRAVGLGFTKGVIKAVSRVAHNYELPDTDDE